MSTFCGALVTANCPNSATNCLRFVSLNDDGAACRAWASKGWQGRGYPSTDRQSDADAAFKTWCGNNPSLPECSCVNAADNPTYAALKAGGIQVPDYCWYTPCSDTRNIGTFEDQSQQCPKSICQTIINTAQSQQVDYSNLKLITTCTVPDDTTCPSGCADATCTDQKCIHCQSGTPDENGKCSAAPGPSPSPSPSPTVPWYLIGGFIFVLLGILLYMSLK